ncbi:hypothetical protein [Vulcanisaeta souniana]|uniref:DUF4870 domain-containing protein n=1 Tax=Vulcanisaeta souniana JCM 11219 TaxID=1293586 RepID=A0ABN6SPC5_9CREN|nr:hypothetical protein [Vulcanisaeta souniana]BDR91224.1 hypothetical protein Vsou_03170 [Vulcanisaeta souniana JCM 11219]BDR93315.1 hypothetical protein Vsou_24080 [Vulcanisaeta souniana JCM 11219]
MSQLSGDEGVWALVAWLVPLVGGVIGLVVRPGSGYVRHWSYLSIAFGLVIIVVDVVLGILSLLTILIPPMHIVITALGYLAGLAFLIVWVIGILRERNSIYWKPTIIYDVAKIIGAP